MVWNGLRNKIKFKSYLKKNKTINYKKCKVFPRVNLSKIDPIEVN